MITHVVIFRTKCDDHKKLLLEQVKTLEAIGTAELFVCGAPQTSERPVVDDTFAVGLVTRFKSDADMDVYMKHPIHLQFNEFLASHKVKVQVFDIAE